MRLTLQQLEAHLWGAANLFPKSGAASRHNGDR